jgi:hypothetical protein
MRPDQVRHYTCDPRFDTDRRWRIVILQRDTHHENSQLRQVRADGLLPPRFLARPDS